ncbi:transposase, partial [Myroides odoratimimus]|nr:transposase [Myroides odoratimimus]
FSVLILLMYIFYYTIFLMTQFTGHPPHWFNDIEKASLKHFSTVLKTFNVHYNEIINYFINRSTNASAESFNAKIKYFRMMYRGVRDKKFFLFRLTRLFA